MTSDPTSPTCSVCGERVNITRRPRPNLGNPNATTIVRKCPNPECKTNERPRNLGTPNP